MRIYSAFAVLLILPAIIGCEAGAPANISGDSPNTTLVLATGATLRVGDGQAMRDMIAAHKGKVVFVDYWATWCEPCVAAFPHTVELSRKHKDKGLATIAVSFDELADKEKVVKFLADQGADFENLLSSYDGVATEATKDFGVEVLPTFLLYDKQGKLRHKWEEKAADLDQKIEELLAE